MKARTKKILADCIYPFAVFAAVLAVWWIAAAAIGVALILPTPLEAVRELFACFAESAFWTALGNSLWRSVYSFLVSFLLALGCAVLAHMFGGFRRFIVPFIAVIRAIPTISVIFILILLLKPMRAPAVVAIIVIFPTLYSSFWAAISDVDPKLSQMSFVYGVSLRDRIFKLYLPNMAQGLFEGAASGFSLNVKLVIAAEVMAHTVGSLGNLMYNANWMLETERLFAITIAAVVVSVAFEWLIRLTGKAVIRWKRI